MRVAVLAALFVSFFPGGLASQVDTSSQQIEAGRKKAEYCAGCHGADGNSELTDYPILAGQTTRYSYLQLKDYKSGRRKDEMMNPIAAQLEKRDKADLAAYYAAERPKGPGQNPGEQGGCRSRPLRRRRTVSAGCSGCRSCRSCQGSSHQCPCSAGSRCRCSRRRSCLQGGRSGWQEHSRG